MADLHLSEHQFRVEHLGAWSDYYTVGLLKLSEFENPMSIKGPGTEGISAGATPTPYRE